MKRGKPMKRTPMKRGTSQLTRSPMKQSRKPMAQMSDRRHSERGERDRVREIVLRRDRVCRGKGLTPAGVCTSTPSDVHELKRGAGRQECYLDPAKCIALCRPCHDWVTVNPLLAREAGLAFWSWEEL